MTELRKQANRMPFGDVAQEEYRDTGKTLGMLGLSGVMGGRIKLTSVEKGILKKQKQQAKSVGSSGATSGLSSSLAFTPVQVL
jgi:U4/U6 small nuclear ribonucleoprotein PRP31